MIIVHQEALTVPFTLGAVAVQLQVAVSANNSADNNWLVAVWVFLQLQRPRLAQWQH